MAMKRLQIIKCSDPQMWYAGLVGKQVPLLREISEGYLSREPAGHTNIVKREDAQVIDDEL
jgi:predicted short-subunit dehydrogenase-like oxidoreductase (DUF2520 family)